MRIKAGKILVALLLIILLGGGNTLYCVANGVDPTIYGSESSLNDDVKKYLKIKCIGDSVTEGSGLPDAHTATIGGATYPAALRTILQENGINAQVENAGHGGENTASIIARMGCVPLTLNDNLVFDSEGKVGPLDKKITADFSEGLQVPVTFTYASNDINPVIIDGVPYTAKTIQTKKNQWKTFLYKDKSNEISALKAGSKVVVSGTRDNDLTIILAGINDGSDITIDKYVQMLKVGTSACGDKYLIVGPHNKMYTRRNFISGKNEIDKKTKYQKRMTEEFGDHFVDLSEEWYDRALTISVQRGGMSGYSQKQIRKIQKKLDNYTIPAEYTVYNKEGNVHLNPAGYYVLAQIIYDRLVKIGYFIV